MIVVAARSAAPPIAERAESEREDGTDFAFAFGTRDFERGGEGQTERDAGDLIRVSPIMDDSCPLF